MFRSKKRIQRSALLFAAWLLFILLLSVFGVAALAGHDCVGEHCRVCACMKSCECVLRTISLGMVALLIIIGLVLYSVERTAGSVEAFSTDDSLYGKRVRLDN